MLTSTTRGFITQMKGVLTLARYTAATVFVYHYLDLSYYTCKRTNPAKSL